MTQKPNILRPRAALLIGAALVATPAFAQDTTQSVAPPPILAAPQPAPAPVPQRVIQVAPAAPVVQSVPSVEEQQRGSNAAAAAEQAPARRTASTTTTRQTTRVTAPARPAAPVRTAAPAPVPAAAPAPVAEAPVAQPAPPQQTAVTPPAVEPAAAPVAEAPTQSTTETTRNNSIAWPWLAGGVLLVLAGLAAFLMMGRRRRNDETVTSYAEPAYTAPVAVEPPLDEAVIVPAPEPRVRQPYVAPIAAAPIVAPVHEPEVAPLEVTEAHEEIEIARPDEGDLAGVADARAPVANRPWLEFGLRPVRAGTSDEEALVDIELTIGNSGDTAAKDVRISTFLLADENAGEMENLLTEHRSDNVPPVTIAPGDGTRVDAHLAVPKGELGRTFNPIVVAEARYTLPDGSEGHTQAVFKIGRPAPSEEGVGAIGATRPHMVENLEAELLGTPEHA